jgi:class 3 adenylate cyclase
MKLGVGIAQGFATLGGIGFEGRIDYAAIGIVTNLAARLCAEADGGEILVSQRARAALLAGAEGAVSTRPQLEAMGDFSLKGFQRPVPVWRLSPSAPPPAHVE